MQFEFCLLTLRLNRLIFFALHVTPQSKRKNEHVNTIPIPYYARLHMGPVRLPASYHSVLRVLLLKIEALILNLTFNQGLWHFYQQSSFNKITNQHLFYKNLVVNQALWFYDTGITRDNHAEVMFFSKWLDIGDMSSWGERASKSVLKTYFWNPGNKLPYYLPQLQVKWNIFPNFLRLL